MSDSNARPGDEISHWNIKLYDGREEQETVRKLTPVSKDVLMGVFDRLGVHAQAMAYTSGGEYAGESQVVNSPDSQPSIWFPKGYSRCQDVKDPFDISAWAERGDDTLDHWEIEKLCDVYEEIEIDSSGPNRRIIRARLKR
jgi:hypothetical protein